MSGSHSYISNWIVYPQIHRQPGESHLLDTTLEARWSPVQLFDVDDYYPLIHVFFFFFSSRRRHTRCSRDWSSDVCSSDLPVEPTETARMNWKEWLGTDEATRWVYLMFGFCAIVLVLVLIQFQTQAVCCGDWDGYYHIRWSALLWENFSQGKWLPEFKWLPLTVLNPQDYADHHFLFHLLQIPFLWFFEPVMAAKVAAVFYASLAIFSVYWLMFYYRV